MKHKKSIWVAIMTPMESNVFRPNQHDLSTYDSEGVEYVFGHYIYYKHAILSGLY